MIIAFGYFSLSSLSLHLIPIYLYCSLQKIQQPRSSFVPYPNHIAYIPMKAMLSSLELQGLFRISPFLLIHSHSSLHHKACLFSLLFSYKALVFYLAPLCRESPASSNHPVFLFYNPCVTKCRKTIPE